MLRMALTAVRKADIRTFSSRANAKSPTEPFPGFNMSGVTGLERRSPGLSRPIPAIRGLGLGRGLNFGYNGERMEGCSSILRQALDKLRAGVVRIGPHHRPILPNEANLFYNIST